MDFSDTTSLLWPPDTRQRPTTSGRIDDTCTHDLDLARTINALSAGRSQRQHLEKVVLTLCDDPHVIRYRQDVLEDLLTQPEFAARFERLFPILDELAYAYYREDRDKTTLHEVVWRMNELARFVECVNALSAMLQEVGDLRSEGLRALRRRMADLEQEETFQRLAQDIPGLLARLNAVKSVTIGVNLDHNFHPVEAALLSVNQEPITAMSFLRKLFGVRSGDMQGIAPLHTPLNAGPPGAGPARPILDPLFQDLANVLEKVCQPIAKALRRYVNVNSGVLADLGKELRFYTGAVKLIRQIRACGLPMCKPEFAPPEERVCEIAENYNLNLALRLMPGQTPRDLSAAVVRNDVRFGPQGRVIILTGPNLGGKTTYLQAVGLTHVLAQAGLYVPGTTARFSPVDQIYTHFPLEERFEQGTGRFGDEAQRFRALFKQATRYSLLLFNESLSSTSPAEGLYLAQELVRILRLMGGRAIFATHLHELAAKASQLNAETPGDSLIISMVASVIDDAAGERDAPDGRLKRSYKVVPGPPMGCSYARDLARRYGVSFEQLRTLLRERGVLDSDSSDSTL
jgi:DNA mismatch repair protein MutS